MKTRMLIILSAAIVLLPQLAHADVTVLKTKEAEVNVGVMMQVMGLGQRVDDPVREELMGAIRSLNDDERIRLVALAWLGRGTYDLDEWEEAVATARDEHKKRAAEYLLGLLPVGTHDWRKFVTPAELGGYAGKAGLRISDISGMVPSAGGWRESRNTA